jgi:hypothetical protein
MKLDVALHGVRRLGVDTAPVIYFIEANPQFDALVTEISGESTMASSRVWHP